MQLLFAFHLIFLCLLPIFPTTLPSVNMSICTILWHSHFLFIKIKFSWKTHHLSGSRSKISYQQLWNGSPTRGERVHGQAQWLCHELDLLKRKYRYDRSNYIISTFLFSNVNIVNHNLYIMWLVCTVAIKSNSRIVFMYVYTYICVIFKRWWWIYVATCEEYRQ